MHNQRPEEHPYNLTMIPDTSAVKWPVSLAKQLLRARLKNRPLPSHVLVVSTVPGLAKDLQVEISNQRCVGLLADRQDSSVFQQSAMTVPKGEVIALSTEPVAKGSAFDRLAKCLGVEVIQLERSL